MVQACLNGVRLADAHPGLPISPDQLACDARAVAELGVRSVHVHPRCALGRETIQTRHVADVVAAIRSMAPAMEIVVPLAGRVAPDPRGRIEALTEWGRLGSGRPDVVAVSVGEQGWWESCAAAHTAGIGVELGVWTAADAVPLHRSGLPAGVVRLVAEVTVADPIVALAEAEQTMRALGPVPVPVLLHGEDDAAWPIWAYATERALHTRIGLEDTLTAPHGAPTLANTDLIEHALRIRPSGCHNRFADDTTA